MYEKSRMFPYKPHPKQEEFLNDTRPRQLFQGGRPGGGKRFNMIQKGKIKNITEKGYGFILDTTMNVEYFFHRDDFNGHWNDLVKDMKDRNTIFVSFEVQPSDKGPRACKVTRLDYPNQAV